MTPPSLDSHPELCWFNWIRMIFVVGDLPHLLVLHILGNLLCNLEILENIGIYTWFWREKQLSDNSWVCICSSLRPPMQMPHGWCLRLELRCYFQLHPLFVSLSKGKAALSKNEETNSSVPKSENKQEAEEMQEKGSPCQRLNSGTLCWLQPRSQHWLCAPVKITH